MPRRCSRLVDVVAVNEMSRSIGVAAAGDAPPGDYRRSTTSSPDESADATGVCAIPPRYPTPPSARPTEPHHERSPLGLLLLDGRLPTALQCARSHSSAHRELSYFVRISDAAAYVFLSMLPGLVTCREREKERARQRRFWIGPVAGEACMSGAPEGIRTPNLLIRSQMLYPLSYGRLYSVIVAAGWRRREDLNLRSPLRGTTH